MTAPMPRKLSHYFTASRRKGREGLPLMSVTMHKGLVRRDDLDRKMDSALTPEEHLLVEPNDIAYNTMRMWQGCFGLAEEVANVSPAYVVMRPKDTVDPRFAAHWFKSDRGLYMLWAYSHGLTEDRLRLYGDEFLLIPVDWPDKAVQAVISDIIDAWDEAIALSTQLADASEYRADLFRKQLIGGVSTPLDSLAVILFSGVDKKIYANEKAVALCNYTHIWRHKHLTSEIAYDTGSASSWEAERFSLREGAFIFTKDSETAEEIAEVAYVAEDMPGVVCGYHLAMGVPKADHCGAYIAHAMRLPAVRNEFAKRANGAIRFGLTLEALQQISIPTPDSERQRQVASLLDAADEVATRERRAVDLLRRQKRGLMQKLLTGEWQVPENIDRLMPGGDAAAALAREASAA